MTRTISNKEIVLGVTGSIAAYKACEIASRLVEMEARVLPVLTRSALELVGGASFEAICGQRAIVEMFGPLQNTDVEHIAVARRADLFLVAPATANVIAKVAHGIADDWLSTTLLATRAPILFAPAMNTGMYSHPATQENISTLLRRGCSFVGPESGRLACKTEGVGRMSDPQTVIEAALPLLSSRCDLNGRRVLITSGGTREPIDPVRFIGNRSSGKMGRALALEALVRGADVTVVSGPSDVAVPYGVEVVRVESASEMAAAVGERTCEADVFIGAAAVGDYCVESRSPEKLKRSGKAIELRLVENPDIIKLVADTRRDSQVVVGFAAETTGIIESALEKLEKKGLDLIVANQVGAEDSGFGTDTLRAAIIDGKGGTGELKLASKEEIAEDLFNKIGDLLSQR